MPKVRTPLNGRRVSGPVKQTQASLVLTRHAIPIVFGLVAGPVIKCNTSTSTTELVQTADMMYIYTVTRGMQIRALTDGYLRERTINNMYACMYVCMYVRMYVCTYVRMYVCAYVRMYVCAYSYMLSTITTPPAQRGAHCHRASSAMAATCAPGAACRRVLRGASELPFRWSQRATCFRKGGPNAGTKVGAKS